jgi:hypothetical protein
MNAVPFDTLKKARKLEASGMNGTMAAATAEALAGADLATKKDLDNVRVALKSDIENLRTEVKIDIAALRTELKFDIAGVRTEMEILRRDLTIRLGGMMVFGVGVMLTAMRYMTLHP